MITWYRPSEKLPEIGDDIVVILVGSLFKDHGILRLIVNDTDLNKVTNWFSNELWTYASNLNLPEG
jgi:hypothetical protein